MVEVIARALVDTPDAVTVTEAEHRGTIVVEVHVPDVELGGSSAAQGRTATAIRTLASATVEHDGLRRTSSSAISRAGVTPQQAGWTRRTGTISWGGSRGAATRSARRSHPEPETDFADERFQPGQRFFDAGRAAGRDGGGAVGLLPAAPAVVGSRV